MSRRVENGYFALVVTCLFCITCIGFIAVEFASTKGYQRADQEHAAHYAERDKTEIKYRECLSFATDLNSARECVNNSGATSRESERAEQDLNAQREMAEWAEGMLWAAWIIGVTTVFVTIIGVRYVYLTLVATQEMARDTREIGRRQNRAYVSVKGDCCSADAPLRPVVQVVIQNHGASPANNVSMIAALGVFPFPLPMGFAFPTIPPGVAQSFALFPNEKTDGPVRLIHPPLTQEQAASVIDATGARLYAWGAVQYETLGETKFTEFCFSLSGGAEVENVLRAVGGRPRFELSSTHDRAT